MKSCCTVLVAFLHIAVPRALQVIKCKETVVTDLTDLRKGQVQSQESQKITWLTICI